MKEKINENRSTDENDNHPKITIEPIETVREHEHNDTTTQYSNSKSRDFGCISVNDPSKFRKKTCI